MIIVTNDEKEKELEKEKADSEKKDWINAFSDKPTEGDKDEMVEQWIEAFK